MEVSRNGSSILVNVRKYLAVGIAALMVVGGSPRAGCDCQDDACRAACARVGLLPIVATSSKQMSCACCCHEVANLVPHPMAWVDSSVCHCQKFFERVELLSAPRPIELYGDFTNQEPSAETFGVRRLVLPIAWTSPPTLPPDDPVSRAQILRI